MNRRMFLGASMATGLSYSALAATAGEIAKGPIRRVALIGAGWYGKIDLFRLMQIAPVEVVALCDVDTKMLSEAADMVSNRQKSESWNYTSDGIQLGEKITASEKVGGA